MKTKIEYPYVVCIILLIIGGIFIHYLLIVNRGLKRDVEMYQLETERQEFFYQQVTDLYFSGLLSVPLNMELYDMPSLKDVVIICLPSVTSDSLESQAFQYALTHFQKLKNRRVRVWIYGDRMGNVVNLTKEYGYDCIYSGRKPKGVPDASIFYLNSEHKAVSFFKIQPYAVHLLDKYLKFLTDHYNK